MFQGSRAVKDPRTLEFVSNLLKSDLSGIMPKVYLKEFEESFSSWLLAHSSNQLLGLKEYVPSFSTGTTQGFDSFYLRHRTRRFRCFIGEYFYHLKVWESIGINWSFITSDAPIVDGDAVVISAPFCDTGTIHPQYKELLEKCDQHNIPVLVDCAYYPISGNAVIDLDHKCIDTVCFSLSKAFPIALLRIGVRYTKKEIFDGQSLMSSIDYNHNLSAYLGLKIIGEFPSDYIYNTFKDQQQEICQKLPGLTASNCAIFAIGNDDWNEYNRANLLNEYQLKFDPNIFVNRICLNPIYENWDIWKLYAATTNI